METFKTTTKRWMIFLGLCIPISITSVLYFRETLTLPMPKVVRVGSRWGQPRDTPVELIYHNTPHSNGYQISTTNSSGNSTSNFTVNSTGNSTGNMTISSNASHATHDERTLSSNLKPDDIQGDMFLYSKQSLDKQNKSLNSGEMTENLAGNETASIVVSKGAMVVEDIPAKDPTKEQEKPVADPLVKDLSGYSSVVNSKNQLYIKCPKCAYVSSSGQLKGTKAGELIDSYPCVIRMNNAPTKGFETDVGSKTTVRVVAHSAIKPVYSKRASLLKDHGQPKFLVVWGPESQMKSNGKGGTYNIAVSLSKEFSKDGVQVFVFSQRQMDYADKVFEIETGRNRKSSGSWLSTGWFTMILSRGICEEITVFGMVTEDHCKKNPSSKVPYHYYQTNSLRECSMYQSNEKAKKNGHRFMTEKSVFARWSKQEPKISFRYPDWSVE